MDKIKFNAKDVGYIVKEPTLEVMVTKNFNVGTDDQCEAVIAIYDSSVSLFNLYTVDPTNSCHMESSHFFTNVKDPHDSDTSIQSVSYLLEPKEGSSMYLDHLFDFVDATEISYDYNNGIAIIS